MPTPYVPSIDNTATQHDGTEHLAINNTWLRRTLTLLALKTTRRFYRYQGRCVPISKNRIVKTGPFVHLTEAATMKFVCEQTSIPVPRVHCAFVHKNMAYIVMERVRAEPLPRAWKKLSDADLEGVGSQMRHILQELRAISPPPPARRVRSCVGGSLRDSRMPRSNPRFGPFATVQEFHSWLREDLRPEQHPDRVNDQDWEDIKEMVSRQDGTWPDSVFTLGDLNIFNVMVRGRQVVGILDWEFAGWYPDYWYVGLDRQRWL